MACCDCGVAFRRGRRIPRRSIARLVTGEITFVCEKCWVTYNYKPFMWPDTPKEDIEAMRRFR